jgi:hypothetical protein
MRVGSNQQILNNFLASNNRENSFTHHNQRALKTPRSSNHTNYLTNPNLMRSAKKIKKKDHLIFRSSRFGGAINQSSMNLHTGNLG